MCVSVHMYECDSHCPILNPFLFTNMTCVDEKPARSVWTHREYKSESESESGASCLVGGGGGLKEEGAPAKQFVFFYIQIK